jgi:hypothetical protein
MKLSWAGYVRYLRKQSVHVQHMHGLVFAGVITGVLVSFVLYTQYGFFHEQYTREETPLVAATSTIPQSPTGVLESFIMEGSARLRAVFTSTSSPFVDDTNMDYIRTEQSPASSTKP